MRKSEELSNPDSCMNRAKDHEMTFVLIGRDLCAPETIRYWAARRCAAGKNKMDDPQIVGALECAKRMEVEWQDV